jgi:hypothetical protein
VANKGSQREERRRSRKKNHGGCHPPPASQSPHGVSALLPIPVAQIAPTRPTPLDLLEDTSRLFGRLFGNTDRRAGVTLFQALSQRYPQALSHHHATGTTTREASPAKAPAVVPV